MNPERKKDIKSNYFFEKIKQLLEYVRTNHQKLLIFLFFVGVSSIFWLIRALGDEYDATVRYPVRYTNFPEDKVLIGEVPDRLTLRINSTGFNILKNRLNLNIIPLRFDVNSFSLSSIGEDTFFIVTQSVRNILSEELTDATILEITPDTLFFRFTELQVKKVPVSAILSTTERVYQTQYMQNGEIMIDPDSVIISGPSIILDSITYLNTRPIVVNNLSDTTSVSVNLQPVESISFSQERVRVTIPVDQFTEVEEVMQVIAINVPDSLQLVPVPGQSRITYRVTLSNFEKSATGSFFLLVDYQDFLDHQSQRLPVFLSDTPSYISGIRLNPAEIEFLIRRK